MAQPIVRYNTSRDMWPTPSQISSELLGYEHSSTEVILPLTPMHDGNEI